MSTNAGTVQSSGALPPVEDADIKPQESTETPESTKTPSKDSKAAKQQAQSQPKSDGNEQDAAPEPQAKEKGPGPWDAKLAELGLNDPKFSEFLRTEVQPYVTQLEQGGQGEVATDVQEAADMWRELQQAFSENPEEAYRELGELIGIESGLGEVDDAEGMDMSEDEYEGVDEVDPRMEYVDGLIERERIEKEDAEYNTFLEEMGQRLPGFDGDLFTQFVVASGGDLDTAFSTYMKYHKEPAPTEDAPPTVDGGGTPPPAAPNYGSIGDAISGWMSENKAANPRK